MDDVYPYASFRPLDPEIRTEPRIRPLQVVFHTVAVKASIDSVRDYFDRDAVVVESHFIGGQDGRLIQGQFLDREADAQGAGNSFTQGGVRWGAISYESEDQGNPAIPWTPAFIDTAAIFLVWAKRNYGIPLAPAPTLRAPGISYHSRFKEWNPNRHACPGSVRVGQLHEQVIPRAQALEAFFTRARTDVVDRIDFIDGSGAWVLQRDGGVITEGRAPFHGSYPGLPAEARQGDHEFGSIEQYQGGYKLIDTHGHEYHFPA